MPKFTDKDYLEILRTRERLAKVKVYDYPEQLSEPKPIVRPEFIYFKNDIRALELNKRVTELENSNQYLIRKIEEITKYASKRRPKSKY